MATRSLAFAPLTGGVELYVGMIAFWTEANGRTWRLQKHKSLKKKRARATRRVYKKARVRYINVKTVTQCVSVLRPHPKQTEILMWGIMGARAGKLFSLFRTR